MLIFDKESPLPFVLTLTGNPIELGKAECFSVMPVKGWGKTQPKKAQTDVESYYSDTRKRTRSRKIRGIQTEPKRTKPMSS
jgi:hypothetical protein